MTKKEETKPATWQPDALDKETLSAVQKAAAERAVEEEMALIDQGVLPEKAHVACMLG